MHLETKVLLRREQIASKHGAPDDVGDEGNAETGKKGKGKGRGRGRGKGRGRGRGNNSASPKPKAASKRKAAAPIETTVAEKVACMEKPVLEEPSEPRKAIKETKTKKPKIVESGESDKPVRRKRVHDKVAKATDDDDAKKPSPASSTRSTWARRKRPTTHDGGLKWDTLRMVFTKDIQPKLTAYSAHEDRLIQIP